MADKRDGAMIGDSKEDAKRHKDFAARFPEPWLFNWTRMVDGEKLMEYCERAYEMGKKDAAL